MLQEREPRIRLLLKAGNDRRLGGRSIQRVVSIVSVNGLLRVTYRRGADLWTLGQVMA